MSNFRSTAFRRTILLASSALALTGTTQAAFAQTTGDFAPEREAQSGSASITGTSAATGENPYGVPEAYRLVPNGPDIVQIDPDPQILIANPNTPTTARDPVNITGIAQMVIDNGGGSVGLCTGSLINPRTILFAAHCVNSRAATAYGQAQGGTAIAFGFETNTRANAAGQVDELVRWLLGTGVGTTARFQTNIAQAFYNVNQVRYNELSLEPAAALFLYGDVATATLDTPAANIPTWALLFSALPNPGTIGASGTGYNVGIVGYGNNGTGTAGASPIDFRRRAAENILGAYTDLSTFESFLFGLPAQPELTQNLYFIDFDDPRRGTGVAPSIYDFNAFRDNARAGTNGGNSQEGITSGGDSGGPLILQNFSRQLVIGVLSGGYTRFFNGQPANSYGTVAFYQPLNLYWDWIAANNPYHYVASVAGNRSWTDPTNWVTTLDPAYYVLGANGQPVNGIPTDVGAQKGGTTGDFGQICFQQGGVSECLDTTTGTTTIEARPIGTSENDAATAQIDADGATVTGYREGALDGVEREAQATANAVAQAIPAPTLTNGLPGATNFVPNNVDPVRTTGAIGRYFDVSLIANGTTTLSGAAVTIDRLTLGGNGATLAIDSTGSLTSLININHFAGTVAVNGTLTSVGDYSLFGGLLSGTGRVNAPFVTSVTGIIAPGTTTTAGTLTIGGSLILSSGSSLLIELGSAGVSDRLAVTGAANLGGIVSFGRVAGAMVRFGDTYTFLTATGGVTGQFNATTSISATLRPVVTYSANAVQVRVEALPFTSVVNPNSLVQTTYARLLDQNRVVGGLPGLIDVLDMQTAATIQSTLEALAPRTETLRGSLGINAVETVARMIGYRMRELDPSNLGGSVAYYGRPIQTASLAANMSNGVGNNELTMTDAMVQTGTVEGQLPEDMSAFIAGGYLDGESAPMISALPLAGNDQFNGWYISAGIEREFGPNGALGFAFSYANLDGDAAAGSSAEGRLYQGTLYGKQTFGAWFLEGQISGGLFESRTERPGNLPGQTFTLRSDQRSLAVSSEAAVGAMFGDRFRFGPRAALRSTYIGFDRTNETGGPTALSIDRDEFTSVQGRAGLVIDGVGRIRPSATVTYVHDFVDRPTAFGANFVGGIGSGVNFLLAGQDQDWFEASGGLTIVTRNLEFSVNVETTIERDDIEAQTYSAAIRFRF